MSEHLIDILKNIQEAISKYNKIMNILDEENYTGNTMLQYNKYEISSLQFVKLLSYKLNPNI